VFGRVPQLMKKHCPFDFFILPNTINEKNKILQPRCHTRLQTQFHMSNLGSEGSICTDAQLKYLKNKERRSSNILSSQTFTIRSL
jgi:hypothetical protein